MPIIIRKSRLLLAAFLILAATGLKAQNKPVTIKVENAPVSSVLAQIVKQTGYLFVYEESDIDTNRKVSVDVTDAPTSQVLRTLFPSSTTVKWSLKGHNITLTSKNHANKKAEKTEKKGGKRTISGSVKDGKDGEPLIGALVRVQGGERDEAVLVDVDGNFSITIDDSDGKKPVLEVSYVGYKPREVPVSGISNIDIDMAGAQNTLSEVIVVGSGTQKKVSVTGSISTVTGLELKTPSTTLSRTIGGRIAGVITKQTSGEPGTGSEFYIRGISTFGGKATPLILLDDVEITATDLDFIPAENIESFTVLKDASATAIYGARGANGVMIVTTKGGEFNSKTKINVNVENSFNFISKAPEYVGAVDFMNFYNKAASFRDRGQQYSDLAIERTAAGVNPYLYPDVNWTKELLRDWCMRQRANLNVSGGGSKARYYMSLEFKHENGLQKSDRLYSWNNNQQLYNYTFQNNISYKLTPTTNVSLNMNTQIRQQSHPNFASETTIKWIGKSANPVDFPVYYPTGSDGKVRYASRRVSSGYLTNPKAEMNRTWYQENINTVNAVLKIDQDFDFITKGLKLNAWVNWKNYAKNWVGRSVDPYIYYYAVDDSTDPEAPFEPVIQNPSANQYVSLSGTHPTGNNTFEMQANVNWARRFDLHDFTAMVMYRMREYNGDESVYPKRNQGISGRLTYNYDYRYLFEFNFGYNGTERLHKSHRFGMFPAASIGWVVTGEKFMEPFRKTLTHLKIRGSYGLVGSDDLPSPNGTYFLYQDLIYHDNLNFWPWESGDGDNSYTGSGPLLRYYALTDVVWEKSRKLDIGLDFTLWGKLNGTLEYFREDRYDIFMERASWPWSLGYGMAIPWGNVGKALNQGFEASVNWSYLINKDLSITLQGNITYAQNKFIYKDEPNYEYPWKRVTGEPLDNYRIEGYIAEGLFRSQEEIDNSPVQQVGTSTVRVGDIKYRDLNGDGKINSDDKTMISKYGVNPRLMYGFGGTLNWKSWDFGFFFTGTGCRTVSIANKFDPQQATNGQNLNVFKWAADNYFDPEKGNFDAKYPLPGITSVDISNNTVNSTYWLRNASYLRLRNLELGWSFKYGRIYANGIDLLCFSKFKLWDPELDGPFKYPLQKSVNVGVQFNL